MSDKVLKEINPKKIIRMRNLAKKEKDALSIFLINVDYLKEKNGWTLERLAEEADISCGTLNSVYYKYCRSVQLYTVEKIAKGFNVSTADILSEDMVERMEKEELLMETYAQMSYNLETLEKSVAKLKRTVRATIKIKETAKKSGMR